MHAKLLVSLPPRYVFTELRPVCIPGEYPIAEGMISSFAIGNILNRDKDCSFDVMRVIGVAAKLLLYLIVSHDVLITIPRGWLIVN